MGADEPDETLASFPTYAALTQTRGWATTAASPVSLDADPATPTRYTEGTVLGIGGMGKVVLARDARIGRDVAVKTLRADRELSGEERARFLREAHVQGQLEHPSIVPVYDIDRRTDGTTFFTMRRVVGRTLHAILEDLRRGIAGPTRRELLQAFATVCLTIDYAHTRGVVHRDLKPANIMLGDFGEVYVLDWGLARLLDEHSDAKPASRLSVPGEMMGTPMYMAPEQMTDPDVGPAADVYALGAILFEILTLELARDPRSLFAPIDARPSVRTPERDVAPELETVCVSATAHEPGDRYASARLLQDAVARYLEGDRELAQRRALAADHAKAAREALARAATGDDERERGVAMRELVRGLALDPTNGEQVQMLAAVMAAPPRKLPAEVIAQLDIDVQGVMRTGARQSVYAMASWFLFIPVILAIGARRADEMLLVAIPALVSLIASLIALRQRRIGRLVQLFTIGGMFVATMFLSRMYGPLILVPTLLATYTIVMMSHPDGLFRRFYVALAIVGVILPVVLERVGAIASSYAFEGGHWTVLPQMMDLPRDGTLVFMVVANIAMIVVPSLLISEIRGELTRAQIRQAVQTWHFRRLADELVR